MSHRFDPNLFDEQPIFHEKFDEDRIIFLDTEFMEDGDKIELISIGMVTLDGRELYCVNAEADLRKANKFVREYVMPQLPKYGDPAWMTKAKIREAVVKFTDKLASPQFWAWYSAFDWVLLTHLFGPMGAAPKNFPQHCMDLKQYVEMLRVSSRDLPKQTTREHDALSDARWNRELYLMLRKQHMPVPEVLELESSEQEALEGDVSPANVDVDEEASDGSP